MSATSIQLVILDITTYFEFIWSMVCIVRFCCVLREMTANYHHPAGQKFLVTLINALCHSLCPIILHVSLNPENIKGRVYPFHHEPHTSSHHEL
jgi:hypothetical protein